MFVKGPGFGSEWLLLAERVCAKSALAGPFLPRCGRRR